MTTIPAPRNLHGLPTLTEVIELPTLAPDTAVPVSSGAALVDEAPALPAQDIDEERLVGRVMVELQRHADLMLEFRLREAIEPALARVTDALVRELRDELAATLRDVVARSVSQELARQRGRNPLA